MPTIQLTNGRHHERNNGAPHPIGPAPESELKNAARALVRDKQTDGLPDGYRIIADDGKLIVAEWIGLPNA